MIQIIPEQVLQAATVACPGCRDDEPIGFDFEFAYQPIVNFATRSIYAHEALVRGPKGESAASVLCGELGIGVLAEGIETRAGRDFLAAAGIDLMQGYFFSKPVFQGLGRIEPAVWE